MYKFTAEHRSITCRHEAAHAVIFSLGGYCIYKVEVAPEGASEWNTTRKDNSIIDNLSGYCSFYYNPKILEFVSKLTPPDDQNQTFICDTKSFGEKMLEVGKAKEAEYLRTIRAYIVAALAGPVAEKIYVNDEKYTQNLRWPSDIHKAEALCKYLPNPSEREDLFHETVRVLREPAIWEKVENLAVNLEQSGEIEGCKLRSYLPEQRKNWPHYPNP